MISRRNEAVIAGQLIFTFGGTRFDEIGGMTAPWRDDGPARCWERLMTEERHTAERERVEAERLRRMWGG